MFKALASLFGGNSQQQLSRVELFFLAKFNDPTNPGAISSYLAAILQQDPIKTARRFLNAGLIESAPEISSLLASTKQAELKEALRNAGLKVSGKKSDLAHRLFQNKPDAARQMIDGPHFILSTEGRARVEAFQAAEDHVEEKYTAEWLRCFERGNLKGVLAAHRAYSDWQIKPPSSFNPLGISLPDDRIIEMYEAIMNATPSILGKTSSSTLLYLRRCAAWDWAGAGKGGSLQFSVPSDFSCALEPQIAIRMVSFAANHNVQIQTFKRIGVHKCEILGSGDSCSHCQTFVGRTFSVGKVPELPHPRCTNEMGCRCTAILKSI
jgi:hypothetical protein